MRMEYKTDICTNIPSKQMRSFSYPYRDSYNPHRDDGGWHVYEGRRHSKCRSNPCTTFTTFTTSTNPLGKHGNEFRKCRRNTTNPITSYGIVLYTLTANGIPLYFICQRRDTIPYMDFIRRYYNEEHLNAYFSLMTSEEQARLIYYNFDTIWDDLWIYRGRIYKHEYTRAKRHFEIMKDSGDIKRLIDNNPSKYYNGPPWIFPKGKRMQGETTLECALREFNEETNLNPDDITVINTPPFRETFLGSDNKTYRTIYFLAKCDSPLTIEYTTRTEGIRKITVSEEMNDCRWLPYKEAYNILQDTRKDVLREIHDFLSNQ